MSSYYRQQLEQWLSGLEIRGGWVLDIGGSQLPVKGRTKIFEPAEYKILDLETPHKGEAPDIVADLNEYNKFEQTHFDTVFCLEVMEYIYNPVVALENIYSLMEPRGTLYISFPFVYPQHEPIADDCLRYTRKGAVKLLAGAGFHIEDIVPRLTLVRGELERFYRGELMRPAKGVDHEEVGYIITAIKM